MQITRLPPCNTSYIIQITQISNLSAPKDLDNEVGIGDLSDVCTTEV